MLPSMSSTCIYLFYVHGSLFTKKCIVIPRVGIFVAQILFTLSQTMITILITFKTMTMTTEYVLLTFSDIT